jgi:hypothetical protein
MVRSIFFETSMSDQFRMVWKQLVGTDYHNRAITLTDYELSMRPTIILQLKGGSINKRIRDMNINTQILQQVPES